MTFRTEPAYDKSARANRQVDVNPSSQHAVYSEPIVDEANEAAATYRKMFSMQGYSNASIQWNISGGVTMTVWTTNDPSADESADTGWEDSTTEITGNASEVDNTGIALIPTLRVRAVMIKRITSDASNASDVLVSKGN